MDGKTMKNNEKLNPPSTPTEKNTKQKIKQNKQVTNTPETKNYTNITPPTKYPKKTHPPQGQTTLDRKATTTIPPPLHPPTQEQDNSNKNPHKQPQPPPPGPPPTHALPTASPPPPSLIN